MRAHRPRTAEPPPLTRLQLHTEHSYTISIHVYDARVCQNAFDVLSARTSPALRLHGERDRVRES